MSRSRGRTTEGGPEQADIRLKAFIRKKLSSFINQPYLDAFLADDLFEEYWKKAFTHRTVDPNYNYEVLETVGDKIIDAVLVPYFSSAFPNVISPDMITNFVQYYHSKESFIEIANKEGFPEYLRSRPYVKDQRGRTIRVEFDVGEDLFESFNGALFEVGNRVAQQQKVEPMGYNAVRNYITLIFNNVDIDVARSLGPFKTQLHDLGNWLNLQVFTYNTDLPATSEVLHEYYVNRQHLAEKLRLFGLEEQAQQVEDFIRQYDDLIRRRKSIVDIFPDQNQRKEFEDQFNEVKHFSNLQLEKPPQFYMLLGRAVRPRKEMAIEASATIAVHKLLNLGFNYYDVQEWGQDKEIKGFYQNLRKVYPRLSFQQVPGVDVESGQRIDALYGWKSFRSPEKILLGEVISDRTQNFREIRRHLIEEAVRGLE